MKGKAENDLQRNFYCIVCTIMWKVSGLFHKFHVVNLHMRYAKLPPVFTFYGHHILKVVRNNAEIFIFSVFNKLVYFYNKSCSSLADNIV